MAFNEISFFNFIFRQMNTAIIVSIIVIVLVIVAIGLLCDLLSLSSRKQRGGDNETPVSKAAEIEDSKRINKSSTLTRNEDDIPKTESNFLKYISTKTFTITTINKLKLVPVIVDNKSITETIMDMTTNAVTNVASKVNVSSIVTTFKNMIMNGKTVLLETFNNLSNNLKNNVSSTVSDSKLAILSPTVISTIFAEYTKHITNNVAVKFNNIISLMTNIKMKGGAESDDQTRRNIEAIAIHVAINKTSMITLYNVFMEVLDLDYLFGLFRQYFDITIIGRYLKDVEMELSKDIELLTNMRTIKYTPHSFFELKKYQDFYSKRNNNLPYNLEEYSKRYMLPNYFRLIFSYFSYILSNIVCVFKAVLNPTKIIASLNNPKIDTAELNRLGM